MDDTCAVCAETLEWVAYGPCGHREVCSTCVSRLRFICDDQRCCICKMESEMVFITKALGDYTRTIKDFSVFPSKATEGRHRAYWYHEDTRAYFDDFDHYSMVRAMCRLSCSVCDKAEDQPVRKQRFRNVEHLKRHLSHCHGLFMCNLCLEGRKVFISEQKLYTKAQLNQHIRSGDSEVDGTESERGGFKGHPMCRFCRKPFYGESELYAHMSSQHETCHICRRQNPAQFDYFRNYDDLESHFAAEHFLCEDEECLAKKFIVFTSEAELKRHRFTEHGGDSNLSRSKRNAALQLPTSFQCRRSNEQGGRRGRGRGFHPDSSGGQVSAVDQPRLGASNHVPASNAQTVADQGDMRDSDQIVAQSGTTATTDSRYRQALGRGSQSLPPNESSFPALIEAPTATQQTTSGGLGDNTLAARLRLQNIRAKISAQPRPTPNCSVTTSARPTPNHDLASSSSTLATSAIGSGPVLSGYARAARTISASETLSSRVKHPASAPKQVEKPSLESEFPPIPMAPKTKSPTSSQPKAGNIHAANKSLVETIRSALNDDEEKFNAIKKLSADFRQGKLGTAEYLCYVQEYGLSHLVLELASLCPDSQKQRDLLKTHNDNVRRLAQSWEG